MEWLDRHDEFVAMGESATDTEINETLETLSDINNATGFFNLFYSIFFPGKVIAIKYSANLFYRSIETNRHALSGTDDRKTLGQHLIYAKSVILRAKEMRIIKR